VERLWKKIPIMRMEMALHAMDIGVTPKLRLINISLIALQAAAIEGEIRPGWLALLELIWTWILLSRDKLMIFASGSMDRCMSGRLSLMTLFPSLLYNTESITASNKVQRNR
jgi:hypothetical protein